MARKEKLPGTPAIRALRAASVPFEPHYYPYVERGGTAASAAALEVNEHLVIKTLIMQDQDHKPLVILMHGDREVSTKALAREIGARSVTPCDAAVAQHHTGYRTGGTSPFGLRNAMPVYVESSILDQEIIYINGGKRGFLVEIDPAALMALVFATPVEVARTR
jgi:Cys-tRNA(Pro) deacylase